MGVPGPGSLPAANLLRFQRRHGSVARPTDERTEPERDRDRILFSSAFRRLAGVTQVVAPTESHPIHNRLTHSLKVAQIGRGLAVRLERVKENQHALNEVGGLDPIVVEAAGLAHDLGHPPFGHISEHELNALVTHGTGVTLRDDADAPERSIRLDGSPEGFEGNAQSFRIVTRLAARYPNFDGLDLCRATLCALLKYPWHRVQTKELAGDRKRAKWGAYRSENKDFIWAREFAPKGSSERSLEAGLMDWADDIAYAVHDLEDFYRAGLIPLDRLVTDGPEREMFLKREIQRQKEEKSPSSPEPDDDEIPDAFKRPMKLAAFEGPYAGTQKERVLLRNFTSELINKYMNAMSFTGDGWGEQAITIDPAAKLEVETLKGLTWYYVIDGQSLASQRFGQRSVIRSLFEIYATAAFSSKNNKKEWRVFPDFFREKLEAAESDEEKLRVVADVIASMSEAQALETHQRLTGLSLGSALVRPPL
jgi:dGTPase